ncbi:MAG TPA: FAD binding domain-containing protein [Acidimicrobiales bacterium]
MKPAPFAYRRAGSLDEALALLAEHGDEAKLMSGGQSLVPLLNMRLAQPTLVVDISRVPELGATAELADRCRYGAAVVHAAFEDRRVPDATRGLLPAVAAGIGYRAIRNRGTLGGSLAHADSSAEWPVVMSALGAEVEVASAARGTRRVPAGEFVQGFFTSALDDDEAVVAVEVPRLATGARWGFAKSARKPGEFAESLAVAVVAADGTAEVWLGAAASVPLRVDAVRDALPAGLGADRAWGEDVTAEVVAAVGGALDDADPYHRQLHGITVARALERAARQEAA